MKGAIAMMLSAFVKAHFENVTLPGDVILCLLADEEAGGNFVMMSVTDARFFSKLGIQTYGFTPMKLPPNFKFAELVHAENERIPFESLEFGTQAIYEIQHGFSEATN
jgi:acetylornithine deacetylase/succinyl-diaminopimelate desuccinylase-like protein